MCGMKLGSGVKIYPVVTMAGRHLTQHHKNEVTVRLVQYFLLTPVKNSLHQTERRLLKYLDLHPLGPFQFLTLMYLPKLFDTFVILIWLYVNTCEIKK